MRAGEPPERVSPRWPAFGELVPLDGRLLRQVTFVTEARDDHERVLLYLNGITDAHRSDIRGALLDEVPGSRLRVIDHLLPDDLVLSYSFVHGSDLASSAPTGSELDGTALASSALADSALAGGGAPDGGIPDGIGESFEGWFRVLGAGRPDERNPQRLITPFRSPASVLVAPGGRRHPAWESCGEDVAPVVRTAEWERLPLADGFEGRSAGVLWGAPDRPVLLLLDAEQWEQVGIREAVARVPGTETIVLVPSGTVEERWAVLPHPERAATLVQSALRAVARGLGGPVDPAGVVVAGQSFGGLAATAVVLERPDLALTAVVQSGSFHFEAAGPARDPEGQSGDLLLRLAEPAGTARLAGRRLVVQSGTEEQGMTALATAFAEAARAAGAEVEQRVYAGGHDHAWWGTGLFDAWDHLRASHPIREVDHLG